MRVVCTVIAALVLVSGAIARGQGKARTLVAVWAHSDDEGPVAPILARYAREGVQVHMIIATDGAQGAANTSVPRGPEIAKLRAEEARCSAQALGIHPPILLGFPDGALGHYNADPSMLIRLAQRLQAELQRLRPDWPDLHGWVGSFRRRRLPSILCLTPGRHRSIRPGQQQR